jgi:hypothetical protein
MGAVVGLMVSLGALDLWLAFDDRAGKGDAASQVVMATKIRVNFDWKKGPPRQSFLEE